MRRFLAVDDCGTVINPMIVEGQIHGGLTEGFAIAFMQEIQYDAEGNNLNTNFTDYLVPTSLETPHWETANTVTPSPHHPMGAKGVGESPNVGSPAAFVNAVIDALSPLGVRHIDMPLTPRQGVAGDPRRRSEEGEADLDEPAVHRRGEDPGRVSTRCGRSSPIPQKVGHCLPDVVDVTVHDPTHFDAVVKVGVGPVRGKFKFKFELRAGRRRSAAWT